MPSINVNTSSMVALPVIHSLCTLELTAAQHFCSNLKHER
jgi:hypothetical protein